MNKKETLSSRGGYVPLLSEGQSVRMKLAYRKAEMSFGKSRSINGLGLSVGIKRDGWKEEVVHFYMVQK